MEFLTELLKKYKSFLLYIIFGVITTIINIVTYAVCARILHMGTIPSNIIAWVLAVAAAYITNKIWVFESRVWDMKNLIREIVSFAVCRIATGVMDLAIMYVSVDILRWNDLLMKVISNALVIILNFIFSKLVIFKKKKAA